VSSITEKATRQAIQKKGIGAVIKDEKKIKISEDLIAEAADDVGHMTGSSREANQLIERATGIIQSSHETQERMRRPDLNPEYDRDRNRVHRRLSSLVDAAYLVRKSPKVGDETKKVISYGKV